MSFTIKVKKIHPDAKLPSYAHTGDAGFDLFAPQDVSLAPGERMGIPSGIAMEVPDGYVGLIWDKSGLSIKNGLKILGGVLDSGFRGEIIIGVMNLSREAYMFEKGHKIAQMLIQKVERPEIIEIDELTETERGAGGFGSTGK
jgi:dUTP pyrophosphatase